MNAACDAASVRFGNGWARYKLCAVVQVRNSDSTIAEENRRLMQRSGLVSVVISGGFGCGKTILIMQTLAALTPAFRVGVVAALTDPGRHSEPYTAFTNQISHANPGAERLLSPSNLKEALQTLALGDLQLLLIDNVSQFNVPPDYDLGQDIRVVIFSVAAGDHNAAKYAESVRWADAVIINKLDLLNPNSFDVGKFRTHVQRLNPRATIFIASATSGTGMDKWTAWLRSQVHPRKRQAARK